MYGSDTTDLRFVGNVSQAIDRDVSARHQVHRQSPAVVCSSRFYCRSYRSYCDSSYAQLLQYQQQQLRLADFVGGGIGIRVFMVSCVMIAYCVDGVFIILGLASRNIDNCSTKLVNTAALLYRYPWQ